MARARWVIVGMIGVAAAASVVSAQQPAGCPATPPASGSACTQPSLSCSWASGSHPAEGGGTRVCTCERSGETTAWRCYSVGVASR